MPGVEPSLARSGPPNASRNGGLTASRSTPVRMPATSPTTSGPAPGGPHRFNIEGYPSEDFVELVLSVHPEQVTLVPDPPDVLTSNAGWDTLSEANRLRPILDRFRQAGIRTSLFIETDDDRIRAAADLGADRIELYTEAYAVAHAADPEAAVAPFARAAATAHAAGLGVNAGHDLNLDNLAHFAASVPHLEEVSIGHALISDALYLGLQNAVGQYKEALRPRS